MAQKTYTVVVEFSQNQASTVHYNELIAQVEAALDIGPFSKGTAFANVVSVTEV